MFVDAGKSPLWEIHPWLLFFFFNINDGYKTNICYLRPNGAVNCDIFFDSGHRKTSPPLNRVHILPGSM